MFLCRQLLHHLRNYSNYVPLCSIEFILKIKMFTINQAKLLSYFTARQCCILAVKPAKYRSYVPENNSKPTRTICALIICLVCSCKTHGASVLVYAKEREGFLYKSNDLPKSFCIQIIFLHRCLQVKLIPLIVPNEYLIRSWSSATSTIFKLLLDWLMLCAGQIFHMNTIWKNNSGTSFLRTLYCAVTLLYFL